MSYESYIHTDDLSLIDKIEFCIFGNQEVKRYSIISENLGITIPEAYDNGEPKQGGLVDKRLGISDYSTLCDTCGLNANDCPGHFGHTILADDVLHYGYLDIVKNILNCVCLHCSKLLITKDKDEFIELLGNSYGKYRFIKVKKLTSSIKTCQHFDGGCGKPTGKVIKEINRNGLIQLQVLYTVDNKLENDLDKNITESNIDLTFSIKKKKNIEVLSSNRVYNILKNIDDNDYRLMGFDPIKNRPENFIIKIFPIPPVAIRPSLKLDILSGGASEDQLTSKLADIIKDNIKLRKQKDRITITGEESKYNQDYLSLLQYDIATYIGNDPILPKSEQKNSKQLKSVSERLKGKSGRIRGNLMGKRVDFSARTVITSDPNLSLDELGVPLKIAMNITFPEIVTPYNIDKMTQLIRNGRDIYPGANFVIPYNSLESGKKTKIDLRYRKKSLKLYYGDIVERHIIDGDPVLFNRQPTLHKMSMMCHKVKVIKNDNLNTFRINVTVTTPYNADFDGDEMNMFVPQTHQTLLELSNIADVKRQIITPKTSRPIIKFKQDTLLGTYKLTANNNIIDYHDVMNLLMYCDITNEKDSISSNPRFDINIFNITKKNISSHNLLSYIIPDMINYINNNVTIKNGNLLKGTIGDSLLNGVIIYYIWDQYGPEVTKNFFDNMQRLISNWLLMNGFSVGLGDATINKSILEDISSFYHVKNMEINKLITEMENNPDTLDSETFENNLQATLKAADGVITKKVYEYLKNNNSDNNFFVMIDSKAKGSQNNIGQIIGGLGQNVLQFKRIQKKVNNRTIPHIFQNDDRGYARGFIQNSFYHGLTPYEFYFHHITGREGMIDTAIKSVIGNTPIVILENDNIKYINIGDWIDYLLHTNINNVKYYKDKNMELLELKDPIYIPTTDNNGNVSLDIIKNVTRHDPTKILYEIITKSGRNVTITDSHSLLIWNEKKKKFQQKYPSEININDYVPVTYCLKSLLFFNNEDYYSYNNAILYGIFAGIGKINTDNNIEFNFDTYKTNEFIQYYENTYSILDYYCNPIYNNDILLFIINYLNDNNIRYETSKNKFADIRNPLKFINRFIKKSLLNIDFNIIIYSTYLTKIFKNLDITKYINSSINFTKDLLNGIYSTIGLINENNISLKSNSEIFINTINILLSKIGIFSEIITYNLDYKYEIIITNKYIDVFRKNINLICSKKNRALNNIKCILPSTYKEVNDVILDPIIKINKINPTLTTKVYDLTIPTTLNFGIANGLHVVDTSDSGYLQRKLIKGMEDIMLCYDKTVRTANNIVIQTIYGDNNINQTHYKEVELKIINMSDSEVNNYFVFNETEINSLVKNHNLDKNRLNNLNKDLYNYMIELRDELRNIQTKAKLNYITIVEKYSLPVNFIRIVEDNKHFISKNKTKLSPFYILEAINFILEPDITKVLLLDNNNYDTNSFKYKDQARAKYLFGIALYEYLNPKRCIFEYQFTKEQFDNMVIQIIESYKKACLEPGEMVGILTAQSLGEVLTQMSILRLSLVLIKQINKKTKEISIIKRQIGDFIDTLYKKYPKYISNIPNHKNSTEFTLEELDNEYYICGVNNNEEVRWNKISHLSRHPTNGNLLKIITSSGRTITTTKSHNFLKRTKDKGIVAITGSELKINDRIPIAKKIDFCCNNTSLDILEYKLELTNNMGWFFGAYLAEGSINGNGIKITNISYHYQKNIYELGDYLNINVKKREYQSEYGPGIDTSILHKDLANILTTYCKKGSFNKEVPEFVHNTNLDFVRGLLRGYFDGDGNVSKCRNLIRVGSRSEKLIDDISSLLTYFGIFSSKYIETKSNNQIPFYCLGIQHKYVKIFLKEIGTDFPDKKADMEDIIKFSDNFKRYNSENIDRIPELGHIISRISKILNMPGHSRTYGVYERHNKTIGRTTLDIYIKRFEERAIELKKSDVVSKDLDYLKMILQGEVIWDTIKEIIEIEDPKEYVYDFTVPNNETFMIQNGIIVHNTLNSVAWYEKIVCINKYGECDITEIGNFVDNNMNINKSYIHYINNETETEYLDISKLDYKIQSVDENGKISWKNILGITRHLPGGNVVKVKTLSGREVVASKSKSFLVRRNNKLIPIEGSNIKVGDFLPVQKNGKVLSKYLDYYKGIRLDYYYGYELGCNKNKIESWMIIANNNFVQGYITGFLKIYDINKIKNIKLDKSVPRDMLYGLNELLCRFGIYISYTDILEVIPDVNLILYKKRFIDNRIINNFLNNNFIGRIINYCIDIFRYKKIILKGNYYLEYLENLYLEVDNINKTVLNSTVYQDVFYDKIIAIEELPLELVTPLHKKVYDLTVADTKNFILYGGLCMRDTFHQSGVGVKGMQGIPRFREILSYTKKIQTPFMIIKLIPEVRDNINIAHKIEAYLKHTLLKNLTERMDIIFDPLAIKLAEKDNINIKNIYYLNGSNFDITNFSWLYRLKISREVMLENDITLLDIKTKFIKFWSDYSNDTGILKKKVIISRIINGCILSNYDNSSEPIINIRLDITNPDNYTLVDIGQYFLDKISIKGVQSIEKVDRVDKQRVISYNTDNSINNDAYEFVIYTTGIDLDNIKLIKYIDFNTVYLNDIYTIYIEFGIEAARSLIIKECDILYNGGGNPINVSHLALLADVMTNTGSITSIDRHGINRLDTDPLSRASFEKTIEQLLMASAFNEVDNMRSISSRIMAGRCIKGGTTLCDILLDSEMIEKSEFTLNVSNVRRNKNIEVESNVLINDIINNYSTDNDFFIP